MGLIEKYGNGVKRAIQEIIEYGLPKPQVRELVGGIDIEIYGSSIKNTVKEKLGEKLGENQTKILHIIKKNPITATKDMAKKLNISTTAIDNNISKLKQKGLLRRIGPDKGGRWEIPLST